MHWLDCEQAGANSRSQTPDRPSSASSAPAAGGLDWRCLQQITSCDRNTSTIIHAAPPAWLVHVSIGLSHDGMFPILREANERHPTHPTRLLWIARRRAQYCNCCCCCCCCCCGCCERCWVTGARSLPSAAAAEAAAAAMHRRRRIAGGAKHSSQIDPVQTKQVTTKSRAADSLIR